MWWLSWYLSPMPLSPPDGLLGKNGPASFLWSAWRLTVRRTRTQIWKLVSGHEPALISEIHCMYALGLTVLLLKSWHGLVSTVSLRGIMPFGLLSDFFLKNSIPSSANTTHTTFHVFSTVPWKYKKIMGAKYKCQKDSIAPKRGKEMSIPFWCLCFIFISCHIYSVSSVWRTNLWYDSLWYNFSTCVLKKYKVFKVNEATCPFFLFSFFFLLRCKQYRKWQINTRMKNVWFLSCS